MGGADTVADVAGWAREEDLAANAEPGANRPGSPPPDVKPDTPLIGTSRALAPRGSGGADRRVGTVLFFRSSRIESVPAGSVGSVPV
jgi:hypothetical protein